MAVSTEELEQRLCTLEAAVAVLLKRTDEPEGRAETRGAELIRRAKESRAEIAAILPQVLEQMGVAGVKPIGAEALRDMIAAEGIRPEDNEFSRGIVQMREE